MNEPTNLNQAANQRDCSIDILRFVGLSLIVLAHVSPPETLLQIRSFDVPMMLFISGLTMRDKTVNFSWSYLRHRALRMLLPVYTFLTVYFIVIFAVKSFGFDFGVTLKHCIGSYLLLDGIGYIWIIRVFLLVALLTPCLIWLSQKSTDTLLLLICAVLTIGLDVLIRKNVMMNSMVVRDFIYYAIGYSIPFLCALKISRWDTKRIYAVSFYFFCLLIVQYVTIVRYGGNLLTFNNFKYPPQAYYIFYGIFMSLLAYIVIIRCNLYKILSVFTFIGCNTIWIYLYHIPIIQLTGRLYLPWHIRYFVVYALALLLCFVQVKIVNALQKKYDWASNLKFLKG